MELCGTPHRLLLVPSLARQPLLTRLELLALEVVRAGRREDKARRRVAARHLLACLERERPRLVGLGGREGQVKEINPLCTQEKMGSLT